MESKLKVEGTCCYCKETFARTGISKHLGVCAYEGGVMDKARDGAYKLPKTV